MASPSSPDSNADISESHKDPSPPNGYISHDDDHENAHDDRSNDGGTDRYSDPPGDFLSRSFDHLKHHWKIILLGQVLSLFLASGGAAQATLHLDCQLSAPTFTMAAVYFILAVVHLTLLSMRQGKERQQQRQLTQDTHQVFLVDQPRYNFCLFGNALSLQLQRPLWQYMIMAFLDVEANAITMLAFKYTTLTSITLLDALAIPSAMVISKAFLGRQYTWVHLLGVIVCMVGVGVNIMQDYESDHHQHRQHSYFPTNTTSTGTTTGNGEEEYPRKIWGDLLATIGGVLYGLNDVLAEAAVRNNAGTVEYLAMIGLFGFLLSLVQSLVLEWDDILEFFGRDPDASSTCSISKGWGLLSVFVGVNLAGYMGASRFLMISEATFFNLSLLTGDLWSIAFSIVAEKIIPGPFFFLALFFVLSGVVLYEMAPHPVVEDTTQDLVAAQQLAEIDHEFELQEVADETSDDEDDDGENDMELL
jgi:solute carrier family 35 protein F1/2